MKTYRIGDIGKVITGYTPPTKNKNNYCSNDYMFISPGDIKNNRYIISTNKYISKYAFINSTNRIINKNDIVVDCIGSDMGNVAIVTDQCISNQQINAITDIDTSIVTPLYLYYLLSTKKDFLHKIGMSGSTMPIISKSLFENIMLNIHDLAIQQHIVNIIAFLFLKSS